MAEQTYLLSNLPWLFTAGREAVTCVITHHLALLLILTYLISLFTHSCCLFSQISSLLQILFPRETELRQLVPLVALESKFSGWILGLNCLPISGSIETPLLVIREMVITLICNNHSFHLCLMGIHWVESKTLGDQVAVAFNLFGNW